MGGTAGRVVAGILTGGSSEAYGALSKSIPGPAGKVLPSVIEPAGSLGAKAVSTFQNKSTVPAAGTAPVAPSLSDAAKQSALDEQKRAGLTGPSDITNTGGASGILTDPGAKYVKSNLLGGA